MSSESLRDKVSIRRASPSQAHLTKTPHGRHANKAQVRPVTESEAYANAVVHCGPEHTPWCLAARV